jgi:hypothetical protein
LAGAWEIIGTTPPNGEVSDSAYDSAGNLYIVGSFTSVNGDSTIRYVAKWNGTTWSGLGGNLNGGAYTIEIDSSNNVYVGGGFTTAYNGTFASPITVSNTGRLAKWDGSSWSSIATISGGTVYDLDSHGTDLYVAGDLLTSVNSTTVGYVFRLDNSAGTYTLDTMLGGVNSGAFTVKYYNGQIYVGGTFTRTTDNTVTNKFVRYSLATPGWSAVPASGNFDNYVLSSVVLNNTLYFGGNFTTPVHNFGKYDGTNPITAVANGLSGTIKVNDAAIDNNGTIWICGTFGVSI